MKHIPIRLQSGLLAACLLLTLTACGTRASEIDTSETGWTVQQMAQAIWDAGTQLDGTEILPGDGLYETYLTASYGLNLSEISDGAIWAAGGTSAQEIAVFQLAADAPVEDVAEALGAYLENRTGAFTGYLPDEVVLLENARVITQGNYVALLVCEDMESAQDAFSRCFTEDPPEETVSTSQSGRPEGEVSDSPQVIDPAETEEWKMPPSEEPEAESDVPDFAPSTAITSTPEQSFPSPESEPGLEPPSAPPIQEELPWVYSEARLLDAWVAGDWSALAQEDRAILDICQEVIQSVVPANGSEYDQELAVHDWMIAHGRYDNNTLSQLPNFQENPNNDNPYGFLVDGVGICLGYTRTFQLFMDLLGIECITVEGTAYNYTSEHAWNQVRLDGEWYCVDVTWDDPTTSGTVSVQNAHRFFNVTSEHMRDTNHQWDEGSVPEATGTAYMWN